MMSRLSASVRCLIKLSDAAKDFYASLKELETRPKRAQEIEAKREEIRQAQKKFTDDLLYT